jgi:hypothetical protein
VETKAEGSESSAPPQGGQGFGRRCAGKQRGAKGKWRDQPLQVERTIPHYPEQCSTCDAPLGVEQRDEKPHGGYYQFELNRQGQGFSIECLCEARSGGVLRGSGSQGAIAVAGADWTDAVHLHR